MSRECKKLNLWRRFSALAMAVAILAGMLPGTNTAQAVSGTAEITTVADPHTLTRPETIYGDNTVNAGKITVGKSVSDTDITVNGQNITIDGENNFLVTISQSSQVMGLASQSTVPVDVVFVIDTSGSMDDNDRAETLVTAANSAINTLMTANEQNRVAVVAFSSEGYGDGTSNDAAASVLSSLAHYTGDAAASHLQWVNSQGSTTGNNRVYIAGRDTVRLGSGQQARNVNAFRHGKSGGTNIQAGIVAGAQILTSVTNTAYTDPDTNESVTRIPFLIVLSDGQPTYTYDDETWYDPTLTGNDAADEQGPGSGAYEGNGFIAALTAAYYKGKITEHYYGDKAGGDNRCFVYTVGVEIDSLSGDEKALAQITLDPRSQTTGSYAAENAGSYWNYGNTANDNTKNSAYGWKTYWNSYLADPTADFGVRVNSGGQGTYQWTGEGEPQEYYELEEPDEPREPREPNDWASQREWNQYYEELEQYEEDLAAYEQEMEAYDAWLQWREDNFNYVTGRHYTFTAESITDSRKYVNGVGYTGGIAYNDQYFNASSVSQMEAIFKDMITTIQQKAISVPTKVTTGNHDFDGYVTFTDPIGDYMEVKDMKGILADGYFYQGASFAQNLAKYGTDEANEEFDALILNVVKSRMNLTASVVDIEAFIAQMKASENQAYYNGPDDYDNSFVWWGAAYNSGEEDEQVQTIGFAENDTIEYIEAQKAAGTIPEGADYVCRSYFFYGEAGGANPDPDHEYLYFMVRVQRELAAPYRETVVISAPASLLSMETVLITETFDDEGVPSYTAAVEHQEPARVVYEVGLWDAITSENVSHIVSADYAAETVNGSGSVNYDAATDTYNFFTNDWDRSQTLESHHRALAKATFDAAADNAFYTYQKDTLIVDADGKAVTSDPAGTTAYYVREYYEWPADAKQDGTYTATRKTVLIEVEIPADAKLTEKDGQWYIPAGAYTAATLVVNGDDTMKDDPATTTKDDGNFTGTSSVVAHPDRTGDSSNSHYTVYLGNNGMLSLVSDPYEPTKTVSVNLPETAANIVDDEGKAVSPGDVLTYTVEVKNTLLHATDITVTDYVPLGTAFVEGSAGSGTDETGHTKDASIKPDSNNVLTWVLEDVPAGETRYVSFQVTVTKAALSLSTVPDTIDNTATVQLANGPTFSSNTTHTSTYGKTVTDVNNQDIDGVGGFEVGDVLVYHIRFHNDAVDDGGSFTAADVTVTDKLPEGTTFLSADNGGSYDAATGIVTWNLEDVAADTVKVVSFRVQINASAKINATGTQPGSGEIYLPNTATIVVHNDPDVTRITNKTENWADVGDMVLTKLVAEGGDRSKSFTINLTESSGLLSGTYVLQRGTSNETVVFTAGKASVTIKHGEELTVKGLPAGVIITVEEAVSDGWAPTYNTQSVTIVKGAATTVSSVSVTNTYTLTPLTVTLKGEKTLNGVNISGSAKTFGFVAVPDANNTEVGDPLTGEVTVQATGTYDFTFSSKVFTKPGTYQYTVYEIDGGILGITYDETEYTLVIEIEDNGDGTMSATAELDGAAFNLENGEVTFTNTYTPEDTQLELTADKALTGRTLIPGEFSFVLTDSSNNVVSRGINDASGNIVFQTIPYTAAGTYTYTMSEVVPEPRAEGVSYDTKTYIVVVTVKDEDGKLVPTVTVDGSSKTVSNGVADTGITFQNGFEPEDVPLTLVANKTLMVYDPVTGTYDETAPAAGAFRFQILEKGTANVVTTGINAADGTVTFNTFYFSADMLSDVTADAFGTKTKTFTYVISEVVPELAKDPNMLYDLAGREIKATLTYTADGALTVSVGGDSDGTVDLTGSVDFINYSNPDSVAVQPEGEKTTRGENLPKGLSFSFKVLPVGGTVDAGTGTSDATVGGSDSETTDITFTAMVYTHENLDDGEEKTYRYWIMESNASAGTVTGSNGVAYDPTRYVYQVTLSRNEYGRLVADEKYFALKDGGDASKAEDYTVDVTSAGITFTNGYEAEAHINLTAEKTLTGRTPGLAANEFDFVLHRLDDSGKIIPESEITGANNASGQIHFATLNYSSAMLDEAYEGADGAFYFRYVMSEIEPEGVAVPGVTYDPAEYIVTIKVTQTTDGMTAELAGIHEAVYGQTTGTYTSGDGVTGFTAAGDTNVTFANTYTTVHGDEIKFQISKTLTGRTLREGEFDFLLYRNGSVVDIATNDENGIVTFTRQIPATAVPGTYEMVIREASGSLGGVTYSTAEYVIYVKVEDDGKGQIVATVLDADKNTLTENADGVVDLTDEIEFVNTYEPRDTYYTPEATKELTGRTLIAGEFSFQVQLVEKDGTRVTDGTVYKGVSAADKKVIFETITYTEVGEYIYTVSEVPGALNGVQYDDTVYYLKVEVTDDGNGHLAAAAGYYSDEDCQIAAAVIFRNTYMAADAPVQLEGTKKLTGRALNDKEFSFVVRQDNENGKIVATGSNDKNGDILFSTFDITAADMAGATSKVFTYVVVESDNKLGGVDYDKTVFTVTVTVTDDGSGALNAVVSYPEPIVFENTYTPASTELPMVAYKVLTGKNLTADEFTFELKDDAGKVVQTVKNDANGVVSFENLTFNAEDMVDGNGEKVMVKDFVYTLSEADENVTGMVYDENVYTVTVTVTDDGNGYLTASAAYTDTEGAVELIRFINSYTPPAIDVELDGTKSIADPDGNVLTGENYPLAGFEFEVRDAEGKPVTTATSDDSGRIAIGLKNFTAAGEYRFFISEKVTERPGYNTDPIVWCAHITIGYDADEGTLYEAGEYIHLAPETHDGVMAQASETLSFVNVYDPADVSLTLKVKKELDGRDLRDHEFTFYMVNTDTDLRAAEGRNNISGEVSFHLTYTKAGTYSYVISEAIPADTAKLGGVNYTDETYAVTVTVTDDGSGALEAQLGNITAVGTGEVDMTASVVFHNTYTPTPVDVTVEAMKRLDGKDLAADAFTFELVNVEDPTDKRTAVNDASGKITFEKITYTEVGEHVYLLTEVTGDAGGVTYDATAYTVTVNVTDDGNGALHATTHYARGDEITEADPVFHNSYKADNGSVQVKAGKNLANRDMVDGEFTFELKDSDGNIMQATNDAKGNVVFEKIEYTEEGVYTYTLYEVKGKVKGVTYDETVYTVTVTVTDNGEGFLVTDVVYTKDADKVEKPIFNNSYEAASVTADVEAKKILTGKTLTEGQFTFELVNDKDPANKYTAVNTADGSIVFSNLLFNEAGVYTYKLYEIKGSEKNVTYDKTVYTVTITVTDDLNGKLEAAVSYNGKTPVFNNKYAEPATPPTGDDTPVFAYIGLMVFSALALAALFLLKRKEERRTF